MLDGILWTAGEGILAGITRRLVLEEARMAGLEVNLNAPQVSDLPRLQEAFLSSTSRAVLPVTNIAGQKIGSGQPGPISRQLLALYQDRIQRELEEI